MPMDQTNDGYVIYHIEELYGEVCGGAGVCIQRVEEKGELTAL